MKTKSAILVPLLVASSMVVGNVGCAAETTSSEASSLENAVDIKVTKSANVCGEIASFPCIEVQISNGSLRTVEFGTASINEVEVAHPHTYDIEVQGEGGAWASTIVELGTFSAPRSFLMVEPGRSAEMIVPIPALDESTEGTIRLTVFATDGQTFFVDFP